VFPSDPLDDWLALVGVFCQRELEPFRDTDVWGSIDPGLVALMEWARAAVPAARLVDAVDACHRLNLALIDLFHRTSLLLSPTVAGQAPQAGEMMGRIDGEEDANWVQMTYGFNMTRSPAGTVCAGFTADGMPVGLQVVGPQHADVAVLRLLAVLEDCLALDPVAPFGEG
jgi:aspartyl-tRNA(Asn)/glutamyl-tRNA(Gln) amidotransferase subunit A